MSPNLQAKLLRVTQDGRFQRLGSNRDIHANVRILAATNRNLEEEVRQGRFRDDLYYRLNVVELSIPPLRERREDILPLASQFLDRQSGGRARFSNEVAEALEAYSWPGNIRELQNAMERAALLSRGGVVLLEHLPSRIRTAVGTPGRRRAAEPLDVLRLDDIERHTILQALEEQGYNRTATARVLGISRRALIYKIQRLREMGYAVDAPANTGAAAQENDGGAEDAEATTGR
jgi:DNA-binding NtrC family response regulator